LKLMLLNLESKKQLYHFYHRSSSKSSVLYTFVPHSDIPKRYANSEMIENFFYNVAQVEVSHISLVKSVKAQL